jgi:hypothetical protein
VADIHVLTGSSDRWRAVFHIAVPNQGNSVSVNYRTALVNSGVGATTVMTEGSGPGQITTAEKAQIEAGEVYEDVVEFALESGGTSVPQQRTALRAIYATRKTNAIAELQHQLKYFGHTESEA